MLSILSWIVTGLVIGLIARAIVPGRQSLGLILTVVLGVAGAFVGGLISTAIWPLPPGTDPATIDAARMWPGWLMAIGGAVLLLWGYVALRSDDRRPAIG